MTTNSRILAPVMRICAVLLFTTAAATAQGMGEEESLYERLGGYDAIVAVTNDLLPRLMADDQLGRFWAHRGSDGIDREKQLVIDFIVQASGGPLVYTGRPNAQSHAGMRISESDWTRFMTHLRATLTKFNLPEREFNETVAFFQSTKDDIVEAQ